MNRRRVVTLLVTFALGAAVTRAHDGHAHMIMGTVMARDARHVEVKTPGGEVLSIALNSKTIVTRAKKKVAVADVQTGVRVVVNIGNGEDPLVAKEIQLGVTTIARP